MQWNLIILRKEKRLKQVDVAEVIGISADAYGQKERGQLQFKANEMFVLSDFFGKKVEEIFLPVDIGITDKVN